MQSSLALENPSPETNSKVPPLVSNIDKIARRLSEAADRWVSELDALTAEEQDVRGLSDSDSYGLVLNNRKLRPELSEAGECFLRLVVRLAEKKFAPAGGRLEIPLPQLRESCRGTLPEALDLIGVWTYLENNYGGGKGDEGVYRKAASSLISELWLKADSPVKLVGGRQVVQCSIYGDSIMHKVMSYHDEEKIRSVISDFSVVAEWASLWSDTDRTAAEWFRHAVRSHDHRQLLARQTIGDHILVVPFKSKFEWRLSPAFSEQFRIFLAQYGTFNQ